MADETARTTETKAGNYFVANYPPFSFWSPEHVPAAQRALLEPPKADVPLGVYLHIPFCRKRCHFCYFRVYTDRNAAQIQSYLDAMIEEARIYASKPAIAGRKPKFVYFGGGTPSYLSSRQLKALTQGLSDVLDWSEAEEVTFECEPGTLNDTKLQAIRDLGVTRLSLGVENFDDSILELNNRAHLSGQVYQAYEKAREVGFPQINIDLIAGMLGETDENWRRCVEETIRLAPDSVTVYQMEIPFNTKIYKDMAESGKLTAPVADWPTKRRWVGEAFETLEANGYRVGSAYTAVREDNAETRFVYRDALWQGADLLPLGVASFGHIQGFHLQNQQDSAPYESTLAGGELPLYRAYPLSSEEALVREFILQLKLGRLPTAPFREKFGVDVRERFAPVLEELEAAGRLTQTDAALEFDRQGLLEVDSYLHRLFLPQHRNARYT